MKRLVEKKSNADCDNLDEGKELKYKICIRCNSPFPAHLKGKVCGCVVEWLVEEQFKTASNNPEKKEIKAAPLFDDVHHLTYANYHNSSPEGEFLITLPNTKIKNKN